MDAKELKEFVQKQRYDCKSNLEKYLNDIYSQKLRFRIGKEERRFIKAGVECLVRNIAVLLVENGGNEINKIKDDYRNAYPGLSLYRWRDNVLKVGSMYDKTRNGFPDEFDFMLVLFTFFCKDDIKFGYLKFGYTYVDTFKQLHALLRRLLSNDHVTENLKYKDATNERQLFFNKYVCLRGPSSTLKMLYLNKGETKDIFVDIVLAVRRTDPLLQSKSLSARREFNAEIAKTGSILYVNEKIVFTETETMFVREKLVSKHRRAYRIVKYLINGLQENRILEENLRNEGFALELLTSHMVKTEIIFHHYVCRHPGRAVALCVLDVLESLKYYDSNVPVRSLTHSHQVPHFYRSVDKYKALEGMTETMRALQKSTEPYKYVEDTLQPLARTLSMRPKAAELSIIDKRSIQDAVFCVSSYTFNAIMTVFAVCLFVLFMVGWIYSVR